MKKAFSWLAVGITVGIAATLLTRPSTSDRVAEGGIAALRATTAIPEVPSDSLLATRLEEVEAELAELTEEMRVLRTETASRDAVAAAFQQQMESPEARQRIATYREFLTTSSRVGAAPGNDDLVERLVEGGFSRARAEEIKRLADEQVMSAIEARNGAEGVGNRAVPMFRPGPSPALRDALGDTEYEQYLIALGQDRSVNVMSVVGSSPAAQAGLQVGDQIVSYAGTRIFDHSEVAPLTEQGTPGEPVIVEIMRDGQPMQIAVPRGPLGVSVTPTGLANRVF